MEEDLSALKLNNIRLNKALQESQSNMEEWKNELQLYKNECERLQTSLSQNEKQNQGNYKDTKTPTAIEDNHNTSSNSVTSVDVKAVKNELMILSHNFDEKLQELMQIRESMNRIIDDLNHTSNKKNVKS